MRGSTKMSLVMVLLLACGSDNRPVDPTWGKLPCTHCGMLVSDKRFAAQAVTDEGERFYFDDLGCLIAWEMDAGHSGVRRRWARVADGDAWTPAETARFRAGFSTPMDSGWAAVADRGEVDWNGVRALVTRNAHAH